MMKSKGYAKGGSKMMKARGGRMMAKGYAKGGTKMMKAKMGKMAKDMKVKKTPIKVGTAKVKKMTVAQLKKAAKSLGMKVSKA